ncbi:MAG: 16S rRNA (cytosine(967)-C(5))-methyltransferase RsmB [Clostridia bacterium]|nr:16S rRNA (cytosine(967)-C(5))-methyltransferase RsmB [Clostridia bacterium]
MAPDAREAAFRLLLKQQKNGGYANLLLENSAVMEPFDARDRGFIVSMVYGVIERMLTLDYQLSLYLQKPLKKLQPEALCLLRLGAYQILFSNSIPDSAAVNETVRLAHGKCRYAAGLINAVLRRISQNGLRLPPDDGSPDALSVQYSCPAWLIGRWIEDYGAENTVGILESSLQPTPLTIRVNTVKTTLGDLRAQLEALGVLCETTDVPDALRLRELPCPVSQLAPFRDGLFHVQDKASMLCAAALAAKPGQLVYDLCAAPGGKSFTIAELMRNEGQVHAFDLHEKRVGLIAQGASRLSLSCIRAEAADALVFDDSRPKADRVLCDVPCSGLGILRQKPEVKYKDPAALEDLPALQLAILQNGARYLKDDGRLVYSTCALDKRENEAVCEAFLKSCPSFEAVPPLPDLSSDVFCTLMPHVMDCDGFFIAAFRKRGLS